MEGEQNRLQRSLATFQNTLGTLQSSMDEVGTNLTCYQDTLGRVKAQVGHLGETSRSLGGIMDGYLNRQGKPAEAVLQPAPPTAARSRAA